MAFVSVFKVSIFNCTLFTPNTEYVCTYLFREHTYMQLQTTIPTISRIQSQNSTTNSFNFVCWLGCWLVGCLVGSMVEKNSIASNEYRKLESSRKAILYWWKRFFFQIHACRNPIHYNWCCRWNHSSPNNINDDIA